MQSIHTHDESGRRYVHQRRGSKSLHKGQATRDDSIHRQDGDNPGFTGSPNGGKDNLKSRNHHANKSRHVSAPPGVRGVQQSWLKMTRGSPGTGACRASTAGCARKTINRPCRKSRPVSCMSVMDKSSSRDNKVGECESDNEDSRTYSTSLDIDYGVDITADNGWDTDLESEDEGDGYDMSGRSVYLESCKQQRVIPASYFLRHMHDTDLEMKHHGLGPDGVKPIAVSLVSNTYVLKLDLSDNWLGDLGGCHICDMMKENCYITELILCENKLGSEFAEKFVDALAQNASVTHIDLSANELDDKAAEYIAEGIMNTTRLEYLSLSRNHLSEHAGASLGPAISENSSIKQLDLSWNSIRRKGAVAIAQGIKNNVLLHKVDLSWNGFSNEGAEALGDALKVNSSLEELDISNNRIMTEGAVLFGKGIARNESLRVLKIGKNPMQSAGCYAVCAAILRNPGCVIQQLDFSDIMVNYDFLEQYTRVKEQLPTLKMRHGGDGVPKKPKSQVHPMFKLQNYIQKHNLRLVDFFNKFDKDNSMSVTREEFRIGIEESGIKLRDEEIMQLVDELDKDGDGEINYSELVIGHQDYTEKEKRMASAIMHLRDKENLWK